MTQMRIIGINIKLLSMRVKTDKRENKLDAKKYTKHNSYKPKHLVRCR